METKKQLKDVFKGISSVMFQNNPIFSDLSDVAAFSSTSTYAVGDMVSNSSKYYKCTTAVTTAGTFSASNWTEITAGDVSNITLTPDYDLPVHLDDLSLTEGDATLNHYKIFGQDSDWVATATKGDLEIKMVVPTKHTDVLKLAYGSDSLVSASATMDGVTYTGQGITLAKHEVHGTIILMNEAKDQILIVSNPVLWATPKFDKASTEPYAIQFSGTLEASEGPDILFLKKNA